MHALLSHQFRFAVALGGIVAFATGAGFALWPSASAAPAVAQLAVAERPAAATAAVADGIEVYKTPTCGCCTAWVDHLRDEGFEVVAHDVTQVELEQYKQQAGLPRPLASCHTAFIGGYAIEGHVPAADIRRLLQQRPDAAGIAVPGMPLGSPGMEVGDRRDPYDVILFDRDGGTEVFASHHR